MGIHNNSLIGGSGQQGYQIQRSVRLRSSAGAYFNRTPAVAGNRRTWTWSGWVKRGTLSSLQILFNSYSTDENNTTEVGFNSSNQLFFSNVISATQGNGFYGVTTAVFRDPSAWYHLIFAVDTTQSTLAAALKLYVNGVQQTITGSYGGGTNQNTWVNAALPHRIGHTAPPNSSYFDGYLTEINFIDGQALTPSSFGETNIITGVWQPKKYTGTYGTNGFDLDFSNNSAATAAAIGKDYSGNGNNFTPNNISVTAGITYDSMLDTPTPFDDGVNVRGNYPTWNPLTAGALVTFSQGNLNSVSTSASAPFNIESTIKTPTSGKWYAEVTMTKGASSPAVGIGNNPSASTSNTDQYAAYRVNATYITSGMGASSSGTPATFTTNDVIGIAYDAGAGTLVFYKNGTLQSGGFTAITAGNYSFIVRKDSASLDGGYLNCGQRPFTYTPPTGFNALNTQNLPIPTIINGANHFAATTYTGTGATQSITNTVNGISFQPDLVWTKVRNNTYSNHLEDSVRGVGQRLLSDSTTAEVTGANGRLTAFNSNGFTQDGGVEVGASAGTYVAWQWKETPSAGFDIVACATNGSGIITATSHNLGVVPSMIILKARTGTDGWYVYHKNSTATPTQGTLQLNATAAVNTTNGSSGGVDKWTVSSSTFAAGNAAWTYQTSANHIAYLFAAVAGYSAFGSYTGNGSNDGPFIYLGFRPRFVLVKSSTSVENWWLLDSSRDSYNVASLYFHPNTTSADQSFATMDFLSNGFKLRYNGAAVNTNSATLIYAAFAENPFKNSLAR